MAKQKPPKERSLADWITLALDLIEKQETELSNLKAASILHEKQIEELQNRVGMPEKK